jgi:hypothetical protein
MFIPGLETGIVRSGETIGELVSVGISNPSQTNHLFPSLDQGLLAFAAQLVFPPSGFNIYLDRGDGIERFIGTGDMIDGRQVGRPGIFLAEALSNNRLAFPVNLDGSSSLIIARLQPISPD